MKKKTVEYYLEKIKNAEHKIVYKDIHTKYGKIKGMTIQDFIRREQEALQPRQEGLFDDLILTESEKIASKKQEEILKGAR